MRCRTRSPTPRSSTTSSSRRSTGGSSACFANACRSPIAEEILAEVYHRLADWSRYWLDHRRAPGSALPYYEHGNDSGWDNSTVFDLDRLDRVARPRRIPRPPARPARHLAHEVGARRSRAGARSRRRGRRPAGPAVGRRAVRRARCADPAAPAAQQACSTCCRSLLGGPACRRRRSPHWPPDRRRTSPRSAWRPSSSTRRTTRPTATGAARSGRLHRCSSKRACDAAGENALADEVSARFRALCERVGLRGELRRTDRRGPARSRLHLDRQRLPCYLPC